jgi:pimeloyl-ACP methyl ester carboxylesterase
MNMLGLERAHIVGLSYSGAVALQLAADAPDLTHTLNLLEPPPVHTLSGPDFREANAQLFAARQNRGTDAALDEFLTRVIGSGWQESTEDQLPGSATQMRRDVGTFFDADMPALLGWDFGANDAARIRCPVLYVGGSDSGLWFAQVRELLLTWFPSAEDVVIEGADHSLALTHAPRIARECAAFLHRHPIGTPERS